MANLDNISGAIVRAKLVTKATKDGKGTYSNLYITFNLPNNESYEYRSDFLSPEQKTLIGMAQPLKTNLLDDDEKRQIEDQYLNGISQGIKGNWKIVVNLATRKDL